MDNNASIQEKCTTNGFPDLLGEILSGLDFYYYRPFFFISPADLSSDSSKKIPGNKAACVEGDGIILEDFVLCALMQSNFPPRSCPGQIAK